MLRTTSERVRRETYKIQSTRALNDGEALTFRILAYSITYCSGPVVVESDLGSPADKYVRGLMDCGLLCVDYQSVPLDGPGLPVTLTRSGLDLAHRMAHR